MSTPKGCSVLLPWWTTDAAPGLWRSTSLRKPDGPTRGRLAITKSGDLLLLLPQRSTRAVRVLKATKASGYSVYEEVHTGLKASYTGEPLIDAPRLDVEDVLSMFLMGDMDGSPGKRNVVVVDYRFGEALQPSSGIDF